MRTVALATLLAPALPAADRTLSIREAVDSALAAHPALVESAARMGVTEAGGRQASVSPNPRLVLQVENVRPYGNPSFRYGRDADQFAYLEKDFETGGKRQRRIDVAAFAVRRAELELALLRQRIAARVKQAYWQAAGARRNHQLVAATVKNLDQVVEYHQTRVREGAMAAGDLLRVRLERERLELAANTADLEAERARILVEREMGWKEFPGLLLADPVETPPPAAGEASLERALAERAEVLLARQAIETARAQLASEQAIGLPNLGVLFGYKRTAGFDTMIGGVQFELPFTNRNRGNIDAAAAAIRASEASLAGAEALVAAEFHTAEREHRLRLNQLGHSLRQMLEIAEESARIAQAAYREGVADLLRLLDAGRVLLETQLLYARAHAEYRQSAAALETAMGVIQ